MLTRYCWHNDAIVRSEKVSPSVASISFHMGTGVFDGLMAYWNGDHHYLHEPAAHLERLVSGAQQMGMTVPWTAAHLEDGIRALLEREPKQTYYIRPIVYRGGPELWLTGAEGRKVDVTIFGVPVRRGPSEAVPCQLSTFERISSRAMPVRWKVCGLYVNSYLARREAERGGARDGLMLDREGRIAEASAANVFFIGQDGVVTPPLNEDVFPGVTRRVILDLCERLGIPHEERDVVPDDLAGFEGAFLCSTLMEIRAVPSIASTGYRTEENRVFKDISREFFEFVRQ
ncbi:aminotransferase class IV [Microvirga calopogonii]|uniref:aminotransferase class IV n=1 Tax=Microvirga calopogonii TaxID=2078013 RepID=UPI000E0D1710|nr:aminotransferase class IV [Microvirga calopogonii]